MPRRVYVIILACLLATCETGGAVASSTNSPLTLLDTCLTHIQKIEHVSDNDEKVTLSNSCPELSLQLDNSQFTQLEPPLEDETTLAQLHDVKRSLLSMQAAPADGRMPELTGLKQLLKKIYQPAKESKPIENPIDKILGWIGQKIREYFKHDNWITRNFHYDPKTGENFIHGMTNTIAVILVVLVLYIIVNELRAADILKLFRRRHRKHLHSHQRDWETHHTLPVGIKEIGDLPLNRQVPALLRYTLQYLMDKRILPRRYNLTNQEFIGILKHKLPAASHDFEQLVDSGERVLYGNKMISASDASQLLEYIRNIEQLPSKVSP